MKTNKRQSRKLPKILSRQDVKKLLAVPNVRCITGLRSRVIMQLLYRAGLRNEEVCRLRPEDCFLDEGYIYIQQSKGKADRVVPIDAETISWVEKWLAVRYEGDYLFCSCHGKKLDQSYVRKILYQASEKAGVYIQDVDKKKRVKPHCLRHCFATESLEDGASIMAVKELLGHKSVSTTQVYTSVRPELLRDFIQSREPLGV